MCGDKNQNGWDEWRNLVLRDLGRLDNKVEALTRQQCVIGKQLEGLRVKSGTWGAAAACVPIALLLLIQWMKG